MKVRCLWEQGGRADSFYRLGRSGTKCWGVGEGERRWMVKIRVDMDEAQQFEEARWTWLAVNEREWQI